MTTIIGLILFLASGVLHVAYAQANPQNMPDTLQREVSVLSDKNVSIESATALPYSYSLTSPLPPKRGLEEVKFMRPTIPQLGYSDAPFMSDLLAQIPHPKHSFYSRLAASYYQPRIDFSSGLWFNLKKGGLLRMYLEYEAKQNRPASQETLPLYDNFFQANYPQLSHMLMGRVRYEQALATCHFILGADMGFARNDFFSFFTPSSATALPLQAENLTNTLYRPRLYTGIRDLDLRFTDLSLGVDYQMTFQKGFKPYSLDALRRLQHRVAVEGNLRGDITHRWEWAIPFRLTSLINNQLKSWDPAESSFYEAYRNYTTLQTIPSVSYRALWDRWTFDFEGGVGLDFDFTRAGRLCLFPHLRTSMTLDDLWQIYLTSTGGIEDAQIWDFYQRIPYADPSILRMPSYVLYDLSGGMRMGIQDLLDIDLYAKLRRTQDAHYTKRVSRLLVPSTNDVLYSFFSLDKLPDVRESEVGINASYRQNQYLRSSLHLLRRFSQTTDKLPALRPKWEVDLTATFMPHERWTLSMGGYLRLGHEFLEEVEPTRWALSTYHRYGASALVEWHLHKKYSLFVDYRLEQNTMRAMRWAFPHTIFVGGQINL